MTTRNLSTESMFYAFNGKFLGHHLSGYGVHICINSTIPLFPYMPWKNYCGMMSAVLI